MIEADIKQIELEEYKPLLLPPGEITQDCGELLWRRYGTQVAVEFPSPKTGGQWQLISLGWIGYVPLTTDLGFVLKPRVELGNLFRMLEYAYRLKFIIPPGLITSSSLTEFYERLANLLAQRVLDRGRKGFYRAYVPEADHLPYVRGQLDIPQLLRTPWSVKLPCHYQEHTSDLVENQILAWTLSRIVHSGICTERVLPTIRKTYRLAQAFASLSPFAPRDCIGRLYNRLNDDYEPMHALCRFFLEHTGPTHHRGDHAALPFLIDMKRLFELFVAEWLRSHPREGVAVRAQETVDIGPSHSLQFRIDLVMTDTTTGEVLSVLDTKYKISDSPAQDDISQVVAYATAKACKQAILVYPTALKHPLDTYVGDIRVRTLSFCLDSDLEQSGQDFLEAALSNNR